MCTALYFVAVGMSCISVVLTQAAAVTDAWDPSASRCLTCLSVLLSTAGLVYIITLAAVHRAK